VPEVCILVAANSLRLCASVAIPLVAAVGSAMPMMMWYEVALPIEAVGWRKSCQRERGLVRKRQQTCCEDVASKKWRARDGSAREDRQRALTAGLGSCAQEQQKS